MQNLTWKIRYGMRMRVDIYVLDEAKRIRSNIWWHATPKPCKWSCYIYIKDLTK